MSARDACLAALTSIVWGLAFVAVRLALDSFSALQLLALRFLVACVPAILVGRPALPWPSIALIGLTLFVGQFLLLFLAYALGLPPGVASVSQQMQAFFTVLLAALFLGDVPTRRQISGMGVAFAGLALVGLTTGRDLRPAALGLALGGAFSWAIGNVLVKRAAEVPIFPLVVWASMVPPVPALLASWAFDPQPSLLAAIAGASWRSLGAVLYLGVAATIAAYACWGRLLQRYPAVAVAPFALLAPCAGIVSSALVFREAFGAMRYAGMGLILAGLAVTVLPAAAPAGQPERKGAPCR